MNLWSSGSISLLTVVIQKFVDKVNMRKHHAAAAVAVQTQLSQSIPRIKISRVGFQVIRSWLRTVSQSTVRRAYPSLMSAWR